MEENAIFTFPAFPPGMMWRRDSMRIGAFQSALGVLSVSDPAVQTAAVRYYHAISFSHNDSTARNLRLEIFDGVNAVSIGEESAVPQSQVVSIRRPIVIGETVQLRLSANAIGGGFRVLLRTFSIAQGLAGTLPGL